MTEWFSFILGAAVAIIVRFVIDYIFEEVTWIVRRENRRYYEEHMRGRR